MYFPSFSTKALSLFKDPFRIHVECSFHVSWTMTVFQSLIAFVTILKSPGQVFLFRSFFLSSLPSFRRHAERSALCRVPSHDPEISTWAKPKSWTLNWVSPPGTPDRLFHRVFLRLGLSDVFLMIRLEVWVLGKEIFTFNILFHILAFYVTYSIHICFTK